MYIHYNSSSRRKPGFNPTWLHVTFILDEKALADFSSNFVGFCPIIIILSLLYTNLLVLTATEACDRPDRQHIIRSSVFGSFISYPAQGWLESKESVFFFCSNSQCMHRSAVHRLQLRAWSEADFWAEKTVACFALNNWRAVCVKI
jgi:hypothetical protein